MLRPWYSVYCARASWHLDTGLFGLSTGQEMNALLFACMGNSQSATEALLDLGADLDIIHEETQETQFVTIPEVCQFCCTHSICLPNAKDLPFATADSCRPHR